jgi:hypothetical protein
VFLGEWLPAADFLAVVTDNLQRSWLIQLIPGDKCFTCGSRNCCWLTSFVEVRRALTSIWLVAPRDLIFFQDAMTDKGTGEAMQAQERNEMVKEKSAEWKTLKSCS